MKILELRVKHQRLLLCVFFSSHILKNERKESKILNTFDLMLKAKVANSKKIQSFMRDSKKGLKYISSLVLKFMVMAKFKASNNNQCPTDWFKMQT
jgi:hypothetical protein